MQQLEAQEAHFVESLVSLQFQKVAGMAKTLWAYTALLSVQDLLLEELSESETLTKLACEQILGSHSPVSAGLSGEEDGRSLGHICRVRRFIPVRSPGSLTVRRVPTCPVHTAGSQGGLSEVPDSSSLLDFIASEKQTF